jgi:hypothetical protein
VHFSLQSQRHRSELTAYNPDMDTTNDDFMNDCHIVELEVLPSTSCDLRRTFIRVMLYILSPTAVNDSRGTSADMHAEVRPWKVMLHLCMISSL